MADYWTKNASVFRRLYQDERKTLEEVKAIAERELHPPEYYTISTYETRLRDVLGLRKKLKQRDWYLIHHYALSRGYGRREYDVLLNGTQIRPDRVWKEIRRYGYHKQTQSLPDVILPKDVQVRPRQATIASPSNTPSQTLDNSQMTRKVARTEITTSSACKALQTWDAFSAALAAIDTWTVLDRVDEKCPNENDEDLDHCKAIELFHDDLPWNRLRVSVLEIMSGKKVAHRWPDSDGHFATYIPNDGFLRMTPGWLVASFATTVYPTTSTLNAPVILSDLVGTDQLIWYHHFASIAFRLTDAQRWELKLIDFVEFGTALGLVQPDIILRIIQGHHVTIRAIWDRFTTKLHEAAQGSRFWFLWETEHIDLNFFTNACVGIIDTVLHTQPEWVETQRDAYRLLMSCAWLRCKRLVLRLLRSGTCLNYDRSSRSLICSALTHAAESGDDELVVALTKSVDMNAFMSSPFHYPEDAVSHFANFLLYIFIHLPHLPSPVDEEHVYRSLEHILTCGCGADVDGPYPTSLPNVDQIIEGDSSLFQSWSEDYGLTCIDAAFYFDRRAFQSMLPHTKQKLGDMTRPGVCEAAIAGAQALDSYLSSRTGVSATQKSDFLCLILAELFLLTPDVEARTLDSVPPCLNPSRAKIARGLLQYGVRVNSTTSSPVSQILLLEACLASIQEHGLTDDLTAILMYLRGETIVVRPKTLVTCLEHRGTDLLNFILDHDIVSACAIQEHGSSALRQAARSHRYEAMFWLIDKGVPVGDMPLEPVSGVSAYLTILGEIVSTHYGDDDEGTISAWRCLVQRGVELKLRSRDTSCAKLLTEAILRARNENALLARWNFFQEFPMHLAEVSDLEWRTLLETVLDQEVAADYAPWLIDQLLHRTADADGKPPLVLAIQADKSEVVQMLLSSKADIEERSPSNRTPLVMATRIRDFALARQLINMGADLNALIWDFDIEGDLAWRSALSEACFQSYGDKNNKIEGMSIIRDMIAKGATLGEEHVSAAERPWFRSPLYICAMDGTLESATLLLQQDANPNLVTISSFKDEGAEGFYWGHYAQTALDIAADLARLDMLLLLLKAGGLSSHPGETGYQGVLSSAKRRGDRAIAEMVQQHICDLEGKFVTHPERRSHHLRKVEEVREQVQHLLHRARAVEERSREEGSRYIGWW